MKFIFFIFYVFYCFYFFLAVGFDEIFNFLNWTIFAKLGLLIYPLYIYAFLKAESRFKKYDYFFIFFPFSIWLLRICLLGGKSAMNALIVEPPIVVMLSGAYILKFFIVKDEKKILNSFKGGALVSFLILVIIISLHHILPTLPE